MSEKHFDVSKPFILTVSSFCLFADHFSTTYYKVLLTISEAAKCWNECQKQTVPAVSLNKSLGLSNKMH